jgi:hypothetical protein
MMTPTTATYGRQSPVREQNVGGSKPIHPPIHLFPFDSDPRLHSSCNFFPVFTDITDNIGV